MEEEIRVRIIGLVPRDELAEKLKAFPGFDDLSPEDALDTLDELTDIFMLGVEVGLRVASEKSKGDD